MLYAMTGHTAPPKAPPAELMASPCFRGPEPSCIIPTVVKRGQVGMKSEDGKPEDGMPEDKKPEDYKPEDFAPEDKKPTDQKDDKETQTHTEWILVGDD